MEMFLEILFIDCTFSQAFQICILWFTKKKKKIQPDQLDVSVFNMLHALIVQGRCPDNIRV